MSAFKGINPSGDWNLYIVDSTSLDNGVMTGGSILNLTLGSNIEQAADLGVTISSAPAPATVSNVVAFHVDFTNSGPASATNVVVSNMLPASLTYLSNACGCAMTVAPNGALLFPLASLGKDQHATFDFYVRGDVVGTFTNTVSVYSDNPDHNPNNDSATALVEVDTPSADLAATISLSPNPVLINNNVTITMTAVNNGYSPATGVMLTNQLPVGLSLVSVSSSLGSAVLTTNSTGLVVASLGDLAMNASPTVTIVATATNQVTSLVTARVGSSTFDPLKGNNTASAKIEIDGPQLNVVVHNNGLQLSWPSAAGNLVVEQTTSLAPPAVWTTVTDGTVTVVNGGSQVQVSSSNALRFFHSASAIAPSQ